MDTGGTPHRRHDDFVSYRDMVEYVAEHDAVMHTARAESLLYIGKALEKVEKAWQDHEDWHRDYLEQVINQGSSTRLAIVSIVIASLISTISVIVSVFALIHH